MEKIMETRPIVTENSVNAHNGLFDKQIENAASAKNVASRYPDLLPISIFANLNNINEYINIKIIANLCESCQLMTAG